MTLDAHPIIIIGAPRSGTNMLRDALTSLPGNATWPCDEINYIWRHGNIRHPSDEFGPDMARTAVRDYIRRRFIRCAKRRGCQRLIEKTCANSLRVGFVDRILPEARYVVIRRDGIDAAPSAAERWHAPMDLPYVARKARFVPGSDVPYYALRTVGERLRRLASGGRRPALWGPRIDGMDVLACRYPVLELAALQWQRCVDLADEQLEVIPRQRRVDVRYEDFVQAPGESLERIGRFLGGRWTSSEIERAVTQVSPASIGKGRRTLSESRRDDLIALVGDTMRRHGYV